MDSEQLPYVLVSYIVGGKSNEMERLVGPLVVMEGFGNIISLLFSETLQDLAGGKNDTMELG